VLRNSSARGGAQMQYHRNLYFRGVRLLKPFHGANFIFFEQSFDCVLAHSAIDFIGDTIGNIWLESKDHVSEFLENFKRECIENEELVNFP
jgi:hypothetical protein